MELILIACLLFMLISGVAAAIMRSGIKSALALAAASIFLSIILFILKCPYAALFELSLCSGLITCIFIGTISKTTGDRRSNTDDETHKKRYAALPFVLIAAGIVLIAVVFGSGFDISSTAGSVPTAEESFRNVFWNTRQADILGQIIIIIAGALAVVVLFRESDKS